MDLNADFSARAAVHAARLDWTHSPIRGVDRADARPCWRRGGSGHVHRSICAPQPLFSAHARRRRGVPGARRRVRRRTRSIPGRELHPQPAHDAAHAGLGAGCTIFVKLWQFDPADRTQLRVDTGALAFVSAGRPGAEVMPLFEDAHEQVRLERWSPGAAVDIAAPGGIEILVLDGSFEKGRRVVRATLLAASAGRHGTPGGRWTGGLPRLGEVGASRVCAAPCWSASAELSLSPQSGNPPAMHPKLGSSA